jgi:hypothetical protein
VNRERHGRVNATDVQIPAILSLLAETQHVHGVAAVVQRG